MHVVTISPILLGTSSNNDYEKFECREVRRLPPGHSAAAYLGTTLPVLENVNTVH